MDRIKRNILLFLATMLCTAGFVPSGLAHDREGYIYGRVTTHQGNSYQGIIRWGDEEAFWDDLFHSSKDENPYIEYLSDGRIKHGDESLHERLEELRDLEDEQRDRQREIRRQIRRIEESAERDELYESLEELEDEIEELVDEIVELEEESDSHRIPRIVSLFGGGMNVHWNDWGTHVFTSRFGDIARIEVIGSEDAEVTMKTGTVYTVSGYANDVGTEIVVDDESLGEIALKWRRIETIEFMPTPSSVDPGTYRLRGRLTTDSDTFEGFIQWDSEECISTDELDGDSDDGSMSIEMGRIRTISRRSRNSSRVELKDGRSFVLEGTNDVNSSIRGIMVEDERYGRVKVSWDAFESVEFFDEGESGHEYDWYHDAGPLRGTVTAVGGESYSGRIVYDLDESETWELLNGDRYDVEYNIPFGMIASISPRSRRTSQVDLRNGESLRLEGGQDVSDSHDGILIFSNGDDEEPVYLEWDEVERVEFD